jgi:cellulose synthase/poly-beta-1,6-N-acetylglucosamine synthase-like glycosyltransferase
MYIVCVGIFITAYFVISVIVYSVLMISSMPQIIRRYQAEEFGNIGKLLNSEFSIPISIIMPTYNFGLATLDAVYSVIESDYLNNHLIIVNDGSTDNTLELLVDALQLYKVPPAIKQRIQTAKIRGYYRSRIHPNVVLIDKEHSNTGDTMNAGLNAVRTPLYATVDADTVLEKDALSKIMFAFISKPHCIAVGGSVFIINDNEIKHGNFVHEPKIPDNLAAAIQTCQYLRSFMFGHIGWNSFGGTLVNPGAFTLYETQVVMDVGGYDIGNYSQDAEIILKLHAYMLEKKYPYAIDATPTAFSWTDVPNTFKKLWGQRERWQRGLLRSFWLHRHMFFNPKYGIVGMFSYPFFLFFEILYPFVELAGYSTILLALQQGNVSFTHMKVVAAFGVGYVLLLTMASFAFNSLTFNKYSRWSDVIQIFLIALADLFILRPFLILDNIVATFRYLFNRASGEHI